MFFPKERTERLKQPLNVLLGTLVGCNISLQVCIFLFIVIDLFSSRIVVYAVIVELLFFTMRTSITSSLWLNVFYYYQIVPAQRSLSIYLKRNIRFFIYSSIIAEKIFFLFAFSENIASAVLFDKLSNSKISAAQWNETNARFNTMMVFVMVDTWLECGYLSLCLCVMLTSSYATVLYLRNHMKSMEGSSSSFSSPRLQRQMRVTITGIIQAFIFLLCLIWMIVEDLFKLVFMQDRDSNSYISCTVVCLFTFGTTINLCVGQTIFRQRVFEGWQKCLPTGTLA